MSRKLMLSMIGVVAALLLLLSAVRRGPGTESAPVKKAVLSTTPEVIVTQPAVSGRRSGNVTEAASERESRGGRRTVREAQRGEERVLTGRVTLTDGTPLGGAVVNANNGTSATTAADGTYELRSLPRMVWGVSASHADCVTSWVRRLEPDQKTLDFSLLKKQPVILVGKVIHHATRQPVPEITVTAREGEVQQGITPGRFEIRGIFSGDDVSFRIEAKGMATRAVREEFPADASGTIEKEYELGAGGVIKGRIVRSGAKNPVPDAGILSQSFSRRQGRDPDSNTTSGEDGRFMLTQLPPGQIRLEVAPPSPLVGVSRFVGELKHDEVRDVGDIEVGEGGTIRGRLIKVPGEEPVAGERVELGTGRGGWGGGGRWGRGGGGPWGQDGSAGTSEPRSVLTDASGKFEFEKVSPGYHQVSVRAYELREGVQMEGEEVKNVTLRVGSGTLRGLIIKDGNPVRASVSFSRQANGPSLARAEAGDDGAFQVNGLAPGYWKVQIDPDNARDVELDAEMPEMGVLEKTFVLPSGDIVGKVVDAQDQPVGGATVSVLGKEGIPSMREMWGRQRGIESGADGMFRISDRDPGVVSLVARKDGMGASPIVDVQVPESGDSPLVTLRLDSGTGTLVSTALNLEGKPVPQAWVILNSQKGTITRRERRGDDGVMRVPDIPPGVYTVQVSAMGYTVSEQTVNIKAGETAEITDVISPAGALRWTVVDSNGAGVAGAKCKLQPDDPQSIESAREGVTDESGLWFARGLLPGSYTMTVTREGFAPASVPVTINAGGLTQESTLAQ